MPKFGTTVVTSACAQPASQPLGVQAENKIWRQRIRKIRKDQWGAPHHETSRILQKSMILQNDWKWNIDDIDEHSTVGQQILKVQSFTQKILIGHQGMSRQSRSTHTVGRGSSRARVLISLWPFAHAFFALASKVVGCSRSKAKWLSWNLQTQVLVQSISHFQWKVSTVFKLLFTCSLDNAPIWFGCSKLANGAALWKIIHPNSNSCLLLALQV